MLQAHILITCTDFFVQLFTESHHSQLLKYVNSVKVLASI